MNNKMRSIKISLSNTFLIRTLCKKCQTPPMIYYYMGNPTIWVNPRKILQRFLNMKNFINFRNDEGKGIGAGPDMGISEFSSTPFYKSYNPKLHNSRGNNPLRNVTECLTCKCGYSVWYFSDTLNKSKPEIYQRKFKVSYPKSFKY